VPAQEFWVSLGCVGVVVVAVRLRPPPLRFRGLVALGEASYILYLIHKVPGTVILLRLEGHMSSTLAILLVTAVMIGASLLLLLLLLAYLVNMVRNSAFLKPEAVAGKLRPLVWTEYGEPVEQKSSKNEVLLLVRRELSPWKRGLAWLKANPLRFGLPKGSYRETLELVLQPRKDALRSQVALLPERDLQEKVAREPETYAGRLFATAAGGLTFLGVPDASGRISRLVWQDPVQTEPGKPRHVKLRKARLLRHLDPADIRQENEPAGWQIG
jgi:hypothetical protein